MSAIPWRDRAASLALSGMAIGPVLDEYRNYSDNNQVVSSNQTSQQDTNYMTRQFTCEQILL